MLSSSVDISIEFKGVAFDKKITSLEAFCGIDCICLMLDWNECYMNPKQKVGECYEWYSAQNGVLCIVSPPRIYIKKLQEKSPY